MQTNIRNSSYDRIVEKHFQLMREYATIVKRTLEKPFVSRIRVWSSEDIAEYREKRAKGQFVPFVFREEAWPRILRKTRLYSQPAYEEQSRRVFLFGPLVRRHVRRHTLGVLRRLQTIYAAELAATESSTPEGKETRAKLEMLLGSIEEFISKSVLVSAKRTFVAGLFEKGVPVAAGLVGGAAGLGSVTGIVLEWWWIFPIAVILLGSVFFTVGLPSLQAAVRTKRALFMGKKLSLHRGSFSNRPPTGAYGFENELFDALDMVKLKEFAVDRLYEIVAYAAAGVIGAGPPLAKLVTCLL